MPIPEVPATHRLEAFVCPLCRVHSHQDWRNLQNQYGGVPDLEIAVCHHCQNFSVWYQQTMILPHTTAAPPPNGDLPDDVKVDYAEAAEVLDRSPRAAAALLRLAVQKLCKALGQKGENINTDIGELVKAGLPTRIQQSLDVVRVVGNNSVHPGVINLNDDRATATALFDLVNLITDNQISEPNRVQAVYDSLPDSAKEQIAARDSPTDSAS